MSKKTYPGWMTGLSTRAKNVLVENGLDEPESVFSEGLSSVASMPNAGKKTVDEIFRHARAAFGTGNKLLYQEKLISVTAKIDQIDAEKALLEAERERWRRLLLV